MVIYCAFTPNMAVYEERTATLPSYSMHVKEKDWLPVMTEPRKRTESTFRLLHTKTLKRTKNWYCQIVEFALKLQSFVCLYVTFLSKLFLLLHSKKGLRKIKIVLLLHPLLFSCSVDDVRLEN